MPTRDSIVGVIVSYQVDSSRTFHVLLKIFRIRLDGTCLRGLPMVYSFFVKPGIRLDLHLGDLTVFETDADGLCVKRGSRCDGKGVGIEQPASFFTEPIGDGSPFGSAR